MLQRIGRRDAEPALIVILFRLLRPFGARNDEFFSRGSPEDCSNEVEYTPPVLIVGRIKITTEGTFRRKI
jgi:hypothetical protein